MVVRPRSPLSFLLSLLILPLAAALPCATRATARDTAVEGQEAAANVEEAADEGVDAALPAEGEDTALPAGHSQHGEAFNEGARQKAYLMEGTGPIEFPTTTADPDADRFVEQGIGQLHGFWYFEAERSFRQAATIDPQCAFAYWGMAMANEGNAKRAKQFLAKAMELRDGAGDVERRMIEALDGYHNSGKNRKEKAEKYVEALEETVKLHPDVLEARAFLCYALYKFRGDLKKDHEAVDKAIQEVFAVEPMHPVHHYRIHLWDYKDAARVLDSAARCGQSSSAIAHMWHMPGHIYSRLKRYQDAVWQQEASARVDHAHMMRDRVLPDQIHNFAHNNEWLIRNLVFIGRWRDAADLAKNMIELPRHPKYNTLSKRGSSYYGRQRLFGVLYDYEVWDELIRACDQPYLEPTDDPGEQVKRLRHLGVALARTGQVERVDAVIKELESFVRKEGSAAAADKSEDDKQEDDKSEADKSEDDKQDDGKQEDGKPDDENSGVDSKAAEPTETDDGQSKEGQSGDKENKKEENKPEESKPEESKPEESKPGESKPEESKPEENKPEENKPDENKPDENQPEESKPEEAESDGSPSDVAQPPRPRANRPARRRNNRRSAADRRKQEAEKAIQAIRGHLAEEEGDHDQALRLLEQAGEDVLVVARVKCAAGRAEDAIESVEKRVKGKDNEVLPLAALVEVLWMAGKAEEAKEAFQKLRDVSSSVQFGSPVWDRLAAIAQQCGLPDDWRTERETPEDVGIRPDLDALGPLRWSPTSAPPWNLGDSEGKTHALKGYQGKPLVLIFYLGHGCLHCAEQLQAFAPLASEFEQAGLSLLAISTDTPKDLKISIDSYPGGMPFPLVSDHELNVFRQYRVFDDFENTPLHGTFVIDGQGRIRWQDISYEPFMNPKFVLDEARRLLAQPDTFSQADSSSGEDGVGAESATVSFHGIRASGIDGALVLRGGGELPEDAVVAFLNLAKREQARLLVVRGPANESAPDDADAVMALLSEWDKQEGTGFRVERLGDSDDHARIAEVLGESTGVWFSGGDRTFWVEHLTDTPVAEAARELLARGGVAGGSRDFSAAVGGRFLVGESEEDRAGLGWLPDAIMDVAADPPDELDAGLARIDSALAEDRRQVGVRLGRDAALIARGRRLQAVGPGRVTIRFAKSESYPDKSLELGGRNRRADLTALRRYAVVRTGPAFPPVEPEKPVVDDGTLMIVGGGGMPSGLLERFVQLAGGKDASLVVIPISMPHPLPRRSRISDAFEKLGAGKVTVLDGRTPEEVCRPEALETLREATGIWFGGGRQWRFMDAYEGTEAAELMHQVLARGGVIAGSSAGASVQGDYMARGDPLGSGPVMADGYERGLRFLKGTAIDQHFSRRNRFADLARLVDRYPQLLGIGVDEQTAIVVQGHVAEVVGRERVYFYDRRPTDESGDDRPEFESVGDGGRYDLVDRKVLDYGRIEKPAEESEEKTAMN